jgi:hypothetical protein
MDATTDIFGREKRSSVAPKLVLGVIDVPYEDGKTTTGDVADATTTGDVAEILEGKYHVMEIFYLERREQIEALIAGQAAAALQNLLTGSMQYGDPIFDVTQQIDELFRDFLDADEISAILPITQQITAAQIGKNSRKKSGYNKNNEARPAFIDSGLFQSSFRSWIEG